MNLATKYLGLNLQNPIIVGASTLTGTLEGVKRCADQQPGAIVLRSLFEEQIIDRISEKLEEDDAYFWFPQAGQLVAEISREQGSGEYLRLIEKSITQTSVPIIASINCISAGSWATFASQIESAGAAAIELNIALPILDVDQEDAEITALYSEIITSVVKRVRIPVSVKIGPAFSNLARTLRDLSRTGVHGFVLFNRYFRPDIDINTLSLNSSSYLSGPQEVTLPVRWIALLSRDAPYDLAGSTGVHDYTGVVKLLLAGAGAVEVASALYSHGPAYIRSLVEGLRGWMVEHNFQCIDDFKGRIARNKQNIPAFERIQFMRRTVGIEPVQG
jgi:dihydroorotate dehydrogenase (fumarate)